MRSPSLMEENRMGRGPGGRVGYDPPASSRRRMRRGPGGRGPPLSLRGQDKKVGEGAKRKRAPSLIKEGARSFYKSKCRSFSLSVKKIKF